MSSYIPENIKARIRREANEQCGYCQSLQKYVLGLLEIEHIIPKVRGGTDNEDNLWLACRLCNNYKGTRTHAKDPLSDQIVPLYNPRRQKWSEHFIWSDSGTYIQGMTSSGRATVDALQLNNPIAVTVRKSWIIAGWHPPN